MLKEKQKNLIKELDLSIPAVAVKYCLERPDSKPYVGEEKAFCEFLKLAQEKKESFYIGKEHAGCNGRVILGMEEKAAVTASGQAGIDFGVYKTQAGCRNIYQHMPTLLPGATSYVRFAAVECCDFDPDLIIFVADIEKAEIIMRATCYISGDFWESKSTPVISCCWLYTYPVIEGKVNSITTGYYHGLKRRKSYPDNLKMIAVPFQKLPEFFEALEEIDKVLIAFRDDEDSKAELARRMNHWHEMAEELGSRCDVK